jgi:hypothetical protein
MNSSKISFTSKISEIFKSIGFPVQNLKIESRKNDYEACEFESNERIFLSRKSKVTPKKNGQFVAIWKNNEQNENVPYQESDLLDFLIITVKDTANSGFFLFPKDVLVKQFIFSSLNREGKRGIRIYPTWVAAESEYARKTQLWQLEYFYNFTDRKEALKARLGNTLISND